MNKEELQEKLKLHKLWLKQNGYKKVSLLKSCSNRYCVTDCGSVFCVCSSNGILKIPKKRKTFITSNGYEGITLVDVISEKKYLIHRMVAECFLNLNIKNKKTIVHH